MVKLLYSIRYILLKMGIFMNKYAFTLTETLVTVVILGIVAAILVPNLINRQVENANRTKVKKAMAAYEKAINFIILENDIKSTEELKEFGEDGNCASAKAYFKTVQDGKNDCIFKSADRVWWDITDLTNPIIILKDSQLNKSTTELQTLAKNVTDKTVFALIGRFDDLGTLRVNDNAYEQGLENNFTNQKYVGKLWYFVTQSISVLAGIQKCQAEGATTCTITANGISTTYTKVTTDTDTIVDKLSNGSAISCIYDRNSNPTQTCDGYSSVAPAGEYWISDNLGTLTSSEAQDRTGSVCTHSDCISNGDYYEAAKRKCAQSGGHLATLAELKIARVNGKMSDGWFWASEEVTSSFTYHMSSNGNVNGYYTRRKNNNSGQVICVGNE